MRRVQVLICGRRRASRQVSHVHRLCSRGVAICTHNNELVNVWLEDEVTAVMRGFVS